ncbi:hypothetical protein RYZ18_10390 [Roseovarius sp. 10]|uniref:hypothetical protein n=1 Tax=Roseovarius sp. 10 TaxID=3080563 RepID=UPI002952E593|nr:hypothetical protein [Roseovarius sp. 10]MDV7201736.1 hypothetical protein [Roseovarius sp. 10]
MSALQLKNYATLRAVENNFSVKITKFIEICADFFKINFSIWQNEENYLQKNFLQ